jgi:hypothetical protein
VGPGGNCRRGRRFETYNALLTYQNYTHVVVQTLNPKPHLQVLHAISEKPKPYILPVGNNYYNKCACPTRLYYKSHTSLNVARSCLSWVSKSHRHRLVTLMVMQILAYSNSKIYILAINAEEASKLPLARRHQPHIYKPHHHNQFFVWGHHHIEP